MKMIKMLMLLIITAAIILSGCAEQPQETDVNETDVDETDVDETDVDETEEMNIVEVAESAGSFNTLVQAVQEAGLVETLSDEGPFTVFAPTDEAFDALPEGTLDALLADEEALRTVLTYHVVDGEYMASDIVDMESLTTLQGEDITILVTDGDVMVNNANVTQTDIEASNGVIHVIDQVILPPSMT
ncbi:fasciclin domain-containing protein [Methanolobus halotolerans]|uniref:Beta-Ig-H3/fasciclin n=1 Tax=Methanolobus halotolerans TaxID=2052935 RepID=A0A4E0PUG5_9EURY|nr:fasciclin domain-containing protein [Methanolobus halotolerans]TGC06940.1 beta-Ig-H3/fasciclin [Methanolobus halotolerans]